MGKKGKAAKKGSEQSSDKAVKDGSKATVKTLPKTLPKTKCCVSKDRCKRCPIRMLKDGTLPPGYTVKKRELVTADGKKASKKKLAKAA